MGNRIGRVAVHVREHLLYGVVEDFQLGIGDDVEGRGEGRGLLRDLPPPSHEAGQGAVRCGAASSLEWGSSGVKSVKPNKSSDIFYWNSFRATGVAAN